MHEATVVGPEGGAGAALDRRRGQPLVHDARLDDDLTAAEVGLLPRREAHHGVRAVLGEEDDLVLQRCFRVDHGGQWLVVDEHEVSRVGGGHAVVGDDGHDGLPDVADRVDREERPPHCGGERRAGVRDEPERAEVGSW